MLVDRLGDFDGQPKPDRYAGQRIFVVRVLIVFWSILFWMYRRKVFLRI